MIPKMQVRDRSIILYPAAEESCYSQKRSDNMRVVRKSAYTGTMSMGAKKRLTKSITLMAMANKPRWIHNPVNDRVVHHHLSFITLTITPNTKLSSTWCYTELLAPFLQWLRDVKDVKCYVWKCEKQKRGQIHYHLVIPDFIPHPEIRKKWNALQKKAGLLDDWVKEHGHYRPPSTEIRAKRSDQMKYLVKDIVSEMAKTIDAWELQIGADVDKEIASGQLNIPFNLDFEHNRKAEIQARLQQRVTLEGKTWDCSLNLSRGTYYTVVFTNDHMEALQRMEADLIIKAEDWFTIVTFKGIGPPGILSADESAGLDIHLQSILSKN